MNTLGVVALLVVLVVLLLVLILLGIFIWLYSIERRVIRRRGEAR